MNIINAYAVRCNENKKDAEDSRDGLFLEQHHGPYIIV